MTLQYSGAAPTRATCDLDTLATIVETDLPGGGRMVWRKWGAGPTLVLLHGGHGSWMHWAAVIPELSRHWCLVVPDLPGFGDSDDLDGTPPIDVIAKAVADGLLQIAPDCPIRLVGFSFGGVIGGHIGLLLGPRLAHFVVVGSNGMGLSRARMEKLRNWKSAPEAERDAIHRKNLGTLMISPSVEITPEMIAIQRINTLRARGRSRSFSVTTTLADVLLEYRPRLDGIWGVDDATCKGYLQERRDFLMKVDPGSTCVEIDNAGHWVAMDQPTAFINALRTLLSSRRQDALEAESLPCEARRQDDDVN